MRPKMLAAGAGGFQAFSGRIEKVVELRSISTFRPKDKFQFEQKRTRVLPLRPPLGPGYRFELREQPAEIRVNYFASTTLFWEVFLKVDIKNGPHTKLKKSPNSKLKKNAPHSKLTRSGRLSPERRHLPILVILGA